MKVIEERYHKAFEEIITINEIKQWLQMLDSNSIDQIIKDIDFYYKMEMNLEFDAEEE